MEKLDLSVTKHNERRKKKQKCLQMLSDIIGKDYEQPGAILKA